MHEHDGQFFTSASSDDFNRSRHCISSFRAALTDASTTEIIYSFGGGEDGEYLDTDAEIDSAGNLYGTSVLDGDLGGGTVWE